MRYGAIAVTILLQFLAGCARDADNGTDGSPPVVEQPGIIPAGSEAISVPYQGTIRAKEWHQSRLNSAEVTYSIRSDRIRRDVVSTTVVDRVTRAPERSGVICCPANDEVVLYRAKGDKKRRCTISIAEYREFCTVQSSAGPSHCGFGRIFCDLPESGQYLNESTPDALTVGGLACDHLIINFGTETLVIIEADLCQAIQVDRGLLALVELNLPPELTGFPLRLGRVETLRRLKEAPDHSDERYKELLGKAAHVISDGLERITECGREVEEIKAGSLDDASFELSSDFTSVTDLKQFESEFAVSSGGGGWDD